MPDYMYAGPTDCCCGGGGTPLYCEHCHSLGFSIPATLCMKITVLAGSCAWPSTIKLTKQGAINRWSGETSGPCGYCVVGGYDCGHFLVPLDTPPDDPNFRFNVCNGAGFSFPGLGVGYGTSGTICLAYSGADMSTFSWTCGPPFYWTVEAVALTNFLVCPGCFEPGIQPRFKIEVTGDMTGCPDNRPCTEDSSGPDMMSARRPSMTGPTIWQRGVNLGKALVSHAWAGAPSTPPEEYQARLKACLGCEYHSGDDKSLWCMHPKCGCNMNVKAGWREQTCPHPEGSKWPLPLTR
jgi:hypothetical protein